MVTTIQVHEDVRTELASLKTESESYEEVIVRLVKLAQEQKLMKTKELVEAYKALAKDAREIAREWEAADKWD